MGFGSFGTTEWVHLEDSLYWWYVVGPQEIVLYNEDCSPYTISHTLGLEQVNQPRPITKESLNQHCPCTL